MAMVLLGLVPSLIMGVLGYALLVTGRRLRFGIPLGIREGWPLRLFGLAYLAAGIYFTSTFVQGSSGQDALFGAYATLVFGIYASLYRWRKARQAGAALPVVADQR
jgi:hypothetical protein